MTINTFTFCKGLIISTVFNIINLTSVKCNDFYLQNNANKPVVPDYDTFLIEEDGDSYFNYHFRTTSYPGQLKMNPKGIFSSIYNCAYTVLPEVNSVNFDYTGYSEKMKKLSLKYESKLNDLQKKYRIALNEESEYVKYFEKTYDATMKAYHAVELFENNENEDQRKIYEMDKNAAIEYYLQNQMPDISNKSLSTVYWNTEIPRYVFKNYELYVDPTEEIYYLSQIIQADLIYLEKRKTYNTNCRKLTDIEYDEVIILYNLLPSVDDSYEEYDKMKLEFTMKFQKSFFNSKLTFKPEDFKNDDLNPIDDDYNLTFNKLKSKFVVNNENFMSYLIRLKKQGSVGFHHDYHKSMYIIRKEKYYPNNFDIDMDIHEENFTPEFEYLQPML